MARGRDERERGARAAHEAAPPSRLERGLIGIGRLGATIACLVGAFFATKVTIGAYWIASGEFEGGQAPIWWALVAIMALVALFLAYEGLRHLRALQALRRRAAPEEAGGSSGPP